MKTINELKQDDTLYGFSVESNFLEIYNVVGIFLDKNLNLSRIHYNPILMNGKYDPNVYIMFPDNIDLDQAILCKYTDESWWIYTTNFDSIKKYLENNIVNIEKDTNFATISDFQYYLNIWKQEFIENPYYRK